MTRKKVWTWRRPDMKTNTAHVGAQMLFEILALMALNKR
jgi:hypothetical protein